MKKNDLQDFACLRLKRNTIEKLRDWKLAIQEARQRKYTWEEFIDICLNDLEMIDEPGAAIYKIMCETRKEQTNRILSITGQIKNTH